VSISKKEFDTLRGLPTRPAPSGTERRPLTALVWMSTVFALLLLLGGARSAGPAWSAHLHHGQPGVFVPVTHDCSGEGCSDWTGTFTADNDQRHVRYDVGLSDVDIPDPKGVPAVDTGAPYNVFPVGGGTKWLEYTLMLTIGGLIMAWHVATLLWWWRRRAHLPGYIDTLYQYHGRMARDLAAPLIRLVRRRDPQPT
jgi:hypothetical protein